jgi:hypothetical protein
LPVGRGFCDLASLAKAKTRARAHSASELAKPRHVGESDGYRYAKPTQLTDFKPAMKGSCVRNEKFGKHQSVA